jgi:hypothetical protein
VKNSSKKECGEIEGLAAILEGRKPAPKPDELAAKPAAERKDVADSLKLLLQFCKTKSRRDYFAIAKSAHDKDLRTCIVSSNPYTQTFRLVKDYSSGKNAWVVDSKPYGPCGIVELSGKRLPIPKGSCFLEGRVPTLTKRSTHILGAALSAILAATT